jgi:hypothetical protein
MNHSKVDNEIEQIESKLTSLPVQGGMIVEDSYFSELEAMIMQRVVAKDVPKKHQLIRFIWVPAAAAIFILFFVFLYQNKLDDIQTNPSLDIDLVADHLGNTELSEDLLCDAGWCIELDELLYGPDSTMLEEDLKLIEAEWMFDEL